MGPDIIALIVFIALAVLGYILGFGKILKLFTGGIFGIIISIIACAMLGGTVQTIPAVQSFIVSVNEAATNAWQFLQYLQLGYVAFYVIMFIVVQIVRIIIVRIIKRVMESESKIVSVINRVLGFVFSVGFGIGFMLLFFAFVEVLGDTSFGQDMIAKLGDGVLYTFYENNPISFLIVAQG